jgi:hypothetical protein
VRVVSTGEFDLPDELAFTKTFYMATYTENDQIILEETISLRQGYHQEVNFTLDTTIPFPLFYFSIEINLHNA